MKKETNIEAFLTLVRAGLWELDVRLSNYGQINYPALLELAEEQSVVGLIAAGLEHVEDVKIPKQDLLLIIGETLQLEERNKAMNYFIGVLVEKMREVGIHTLLVKGQGVAQCYERPLWRSSGDVDFYLSGSDYQAAKKFLIHLASHVEDEDCNRLHLGMTIDQWAVELHGTLHSDFSCRMNKGLDDVHRAIFNGGDVRSWNNDGVLVFMPSADNDVIIVFTHFLQHFYVGGIGLRQICDWCRLLWTYRDSLNHGLLESRIRRMGLLTEWKAFAAFAVEYLGMPVETTPFYDNKNKWRRKASVLKNIMIETGDLGKNVDDSYRNSSKRLKKNVITFWVRLKEFSRLTLLFPHNSPRFFVYYVFNRMKNKRVI